MQIRFKTDKVVPLRTSRSVANLKCNLKFYPKDTSVTWGHYTAFSSPTDPGAEHHLMQKSETPGVDLVDVGAVVKQFDGDVSESAPKGETERRLSQRIGETKIDRRTRVGRRSAAAQENLDHAQVTATSDIEEE